MAVSNLNPKVKMLAQQVMDGLKWSITLAQVHQRFTSPVGESKGEAAGSLRKTKGSGAGAGAEGGGASAEKGGNPLQKILQGSQRETRSALPALTAEIMATAPSASRQFQIVQEAAAAAARQGREQ